MKRAFIAVGLGLFLSGCMMKMDGGGSGGNNEISAEEFSGYTYHNYEDGNYSMKINSGSEIRLTVRENRCPHRVSGSVIRLQKFDDRVHVTYKYKAATLISYDVRDADMSYCANYLHRLNYEVLGLEITSIRSQTEIEKNDFILYY